MEQQDQDQPKSPERRRFLANLMMLSIAGTPAFVKLCERLLKGQEKNSPVEIEPISTQAKAFGTTSPFFGQDDSGEKQTAETGVAKQRQRYETEPGIQQRIKNTIRWEKLVGECVGDLKGRGLALEPVVEKIILPLIFVESGGDPQADSGVAFGLCQLRNEAALDAAKTLGVKFALEELPQKLKDPRMNITYGLIHLNNLYWSYPEPGLAIWAYHLGAGNMINALRTYLVSTAGIPEAEVWQTLGKRPTLENPALGTNTLVQENKINAIALLTSPPVKRELQKRKALNDDTEYYLYRVAAAAEVLSSKT